MSNLVMFDSHNYDTFKEAEKYGATYSTPSTVDCICTEVIGGVLDMIEVVECFKQCTGSTGIVAGIVDNMSGDFITLEQLAKMAK